MKPHSPNVSRLRNHRPERGPLRLRETAAGNLRTRRSALWGRRIVAFGCAWLAGSVLFTGCLSKPALPRQTFALANPSPAAAPGAGVDVLAIRTCDVAATFASRSFAYRIGPDQYELDPYAGFLATPALAVGIPLREHLRNRGVFRDIVPADSAIPANAWLDVHIAELYGDFRHPAQPAAVLTLQFRFTTTEPGQRTKTLMQKDYTRSIPLKLRTAAAVVVGWDTALAEIMQAVGTDLAAALAN